MTQVKDGLMDLSKQDLLPESSDYVSRILRIAITKKGNGEGAFLQVVSGPPDTVGKKTYLYLLNTDTGQAIGLSQLLKSLQLTEVPSGQYGDNDTQNLVGVEFEATISIGEDSKTKQDRNNVTPNFDVEWWNAVLANDGEDPNQSTATKRRAKKKAGARR